MKKEKNEKKQKRLLPILFFVTALLTAPFGIAGKTFAQETQAVEQESEGETEKSAWEIQNAVNSERGGIVRVESICWDGEEEIYSTKAFSGFVVCQEESGGIYIATVQEDLAYTSEEKEKIRKKNKLEDNARISTKTEVIFNGDLRVEAETVGESVQRNITVLKLSQTIAFDGALSFAGENISNTENVYLLGYPDFSEEESAVYNEENVRVEAGQIQDVTEEDEVTILWHDVQADPTCIGGPLLDESGFVVGMVLSVKEETEAGTAVSSEDIKDFLKSFEIGFQEEAEAAQEEAKLPLLNIILGAVLVFLFILVLIRQRKGRTFVYQEEPERKPGKRKKGKNREMAEPYGALASGPPPGAYAASCRASLEYPAGRKRAQIGGAQFIIGRDADADFSLPECRGISRKHACIRFDGAGFCLTDLNSTNHTFLNGSMLAPKEERRLRDGDQVTVGKEIMIFHEER